MNGRLLKQITEVQIKEAVVLLSTKNYCVAYYLAGYSIECALKACIAQKRKRMLKKKVGLTFHWVMYR
jgi:HEPN domain-containing protein